MSAQGVNKIGVSAACTITFEIKQNLVNKAC